MDNRTVKKQVFHINGTDYQNLDEVPEQLRQVLDKDSNGQIDMVERMAEGKSPFSTVTMKDVLALLKGESPSDGRVQDQASNGSVPPVETGSFGNILRIVVILFIIVIAVFIFIF